MPTNVSAFTNDAGYTTSSDVNTAISNKIWIGTQQQYDNLGTYSDSTLYFIKEDNNAS